MVNERRLTRLETLMAGLYVLIIGMKLAPLIFTPAFISALGSALGW